MALLDEANISKYGNQEITTVNLGVRNNSAILISGHVKIKRHKKAKLN